MHFHWLKLYKRFHITSNLLYNGIREFIQYIWLYLLLFWYICSPELVSQLRSGRYRPRSLRIETTTHVHDEFPIGHYKSRDLNWLTDLGLQMDQNSKGYGQMYWINSSRMSLYEKEKVMYTSSQLGTTNLELYIRSSWNYTHMHMSINKCCLFFFRILWPYYVLSV